MECIQDGRVKVRITLVDEPMLDSLRTVIDHNDEDWVSVTDLIIEYHS